MAILLSALGVVADAVKCSLPISLIPLWSSSLIVLYLQSRPYLWSRGMRVVLKAPRFDGLLVRWSIRHFISVSNVSSAVRTATAASEMIFIDWTILKSHLLYACRSLLRMQSQSSLHGSKHAGMSETLGGMVYLFLWVLYCWETVRMFLNCSHESSLTDSLMEGVFTPCKRQDRVVIKFNYASDPYRTILALNIIQLSVDIIVSTFPSL